MAKLQSTEITGSLIVSGSSAPLYVEGSGSTILDIQGSQGQLFSVTDDLTGTLFSVSDISGIPILEVDASGVSSFDGSVGIGTNSPGYKTDVINTDSNQTTLDSLTFRARSENYAGTVAAFENNSGVNTNIRISDTVDDMYVVSRDGIMGLGPSGGWSSTNLNITSGGFVGIGERNPSERLHVKNGNLRVEDGIISFYDGVANRGYIGSNGSLFEVSSTSKILFKTGATPTEKMRLTDDGRLLLNTPDDASATNSRFEAIGTSTDASTNMTFKTNGKLGLGDYDPVAKITVVGSTNPVTSNLIHITNTSNGGSVIDFRNSGNTQAGKISMPSSTTVNYGTTSDYRLKTNVVDLENGIEKVKKLKPSRFEWIENGIEVDGFIAHEVAEVVPEAVTGVKDAIDENNDPVYQDLDYSKVIPVLTAALKEAIQKIELLETRIQTLENN
ncbi:tail fiber domain-containing protein [bacterium]|nr:tail fiber domain-containing protein [bacterium]